jgi:hypothetical protein
MRDPGRYYLLGDDDGEYSATAGDYWGAPDSASMGTLIRLAHPWRTATGRTVYARRVIRERATMRDLRRLERAGWRIGGTR